MEVTFWGVRGSTPAPGPGTVRYGGNTSCVSVRTHHGALLVLDCGTGARNLGLALMGEDAAGSGFRAGQGEAAILLSHLHWDHIQGFPFFSPLYVEGNNFQIFGPAETSPRLVEILEGQMAPPYFPVQTLKNMGARIDIRAVTPGTSFEVLGCRVATVDNPHAPASAMAFRIDDGRSSLAYASDVAYGPAGPTPATLALYHGVDLLIHDSTYTPEDRARYPRRGLGSMTDAIAAAVRARARRVALFHYDQDYTDADIDAMLARGRREMEGPPDNVEVLAAAEGLTLTL